MTVLRLITMMRDKFIYCIVIQNYNHYPIFQIRNMSASKAALLKRREKDIFKLRTSKYNLDTDQKEGYYQLDFEGPSDTPYEDGKWRINLYLPDQYPYKSPSVGFLNRIYHPNIDYCSGSVCLDVINQTWTPMYELVNIFEIFLPQLLTYPNPASPLNQEAATLFEEDIESYNKKVKTEIGKYALNKELIQIRKKSEQLEKIKDQKMKLAVQKKEEVENNSEGIEAEPMDEDGDEGSSLSEHNSISEDHSDLKLY